MGDLLGSALLGCSCQLLGSTSTDLFGSTSGLLGTDDDPFSSPHLGLFRGPIGRIRGASSSDDLCGGACILGGPGDHHDACTCTSSCADHHDACTCTSSCADHHDACTCTSDLCGGACILGGPGSNDICSTPCLLGSSGDDLCGGACIFNGPCNNDTCGTCLLGSSDDDYCGVACIFGCPGNNDIWRTRLLSRARLLGGTNLRGIRYDVSPSDHRTCRIRCDVSTNLRGIRCDVSNVWGIRGIRGIHYDVSRACLFCSPSDHRTWRRIRYDASNVWTIFFLCLDDLVRLASALADAMAYVFATVISLLFWRLLAKGILKIKVFCK